MTTVSGRCFCGDVNYEIRMPTKFCGHCHCSMCRRPHGASFVTWVGVAPEQFEVTKGEDLLHEFASSEHGRRQFCGRCGTQLFCYHVEEDGSTKLMDVTLASLDGPIDREPAAHFYYDSRADWTRVEDDLPKLGGATGIEPLP